VLFAVREIILSNQKQCVRDFQPPEERVASHHWKQRVLPAKEGTKLLPVRIVEECWHVQKVT